MVQIAPFNSGYPTTITTTGTSIGQTGDFPLTTGVSYYYWPYPWNTSPPTECSGDVHVFPCPHCDSCKCGGATKKHKGKVGKKTQ